MLSRKLSICAQSFPAPPTTGILGSKDATALAGEIAKYLQVASIAAWSDLEASGTLTFPGGDAHSAELYLSGTQNSRLDIVMDSGHAEPQGKSVLGDDSRRKRKRAFPVPRNVRERNCGLSKTLVRGFHFRTAFPARSGTRPQSKGKACIGSQSESTRMRKRRDFIQLSPQISILIQ